MVGVAGDLRRHLARTLPEPMIPSPFVALDSLPLTPGGELDRSALPEPSGRPASERTYLAPRGPAEELVAGIGAEVPGLERVGVTDDFFGLGGHSPPATRVVARLTSAVGLDVPLRTVFAARTVAGLAEAVEGLLVAEIEQLSDEEADRLVARSGA
jgi:Phosphopantetheine attachment site